MTPDSAVLALERRHTLAPLDELPQGLDAFFHGLQGRWLRRRSQAAGLALDAERALQACEALSGADAAELERRLADARAWMSLDVRRGRLAQARQLIRTGCGPCRQRCACATHLA